jgi:hypothetical protein
MPMESPLDPAPDPPPESALVPDAAAGGSVGSSAGIQAPASDATRYSNAQLARARELLTRLSAVRRSARFYPMDHPAVRRA